MKIEVDDDSFEKEVIQKSNEVLVVVDFWAPWCMPCRVLGPVLEKIADEYDGKFLLAKINVQENTMVADKYQILSIPNVKFFRNGGVVDEFVGAMPEQIVKQYIDKNINK
ncbi:thioredoxin [Candidatus Micrarchaeota archaeon]|nr:thioredoxin [Candidatus Micrarchaeota archaeon]